MNLTSPEGLSGLKFDDVVLDVKPGIARAIFFFFLLAGSQSENKADICSKAELRKSKRTRTRRLIKYLLKFPQLLELSMAELILKI